MTINLKRYNETRHLHFVTFSCYRRLPLLGSPQSRNVFISALQEVRKRHAFLLVGYVVMPEHVHLLMSEPMKIPPSLALRVLKQQVAVQIPPTDYPRFWEPRYYDFNVHSFSKRGQKLHYMHMNPINRGLVRHPGSWPWSSFLNYEGDSSALIPIDFID